MLGLGEAGGTIAGDLRASGADVRGYDPLPETHPDVATPVEAVEGADVVISLTTAAEALAAARAAGVEEWMREELVGLFGTTDEAALVRMEQGSRRHARRRAHELGDVAALLGELGVASPLSDAARLQLEAFLDDNPS